MGFHRELCEKTQVGRFLRREPRRRHRGPQRTCSNQDTLRVLCERYQVRLSYYTKDRGEDTEDHKGFVQTWDTLLRALREKLC